MTRQLHLGVFIYPGGHHIAAWRHPDMRAERITDAATRLADLCMAAGAAA